MMLSIDAIADTVNARAIAAGQDADEGLLVSMRSLGQLQPIVVKRDGDANGYALIAGRRRLAAARALGWTEINAHEVTADPTSSDAMSAAENMVRAPMHPVDTWRAMHGLVRSGFSLAGAADALGLDHRVARRLDHLGDMVPELVDAIAGEPELPGDQILRVISMAPVEVQRKALLSAQKVQGKRERLDWWRIAQSCTRQHITASRAIFSTAPAENGGAGVVFDEDLFAEPGSPEQFTTTDVKGFLAAQRAALADKAQASKGRIVVAPLDKDHMSPVLPAGWRQSYDPLPKRWRRDDPRCAFAAVQESGYSIGEVRYVIAYPKAKPAVQAGASETQGEDATPARAPRDPITKGVQGRLAAMKGEALRQRLEETAPETLPSDMLRALLLALTFNNVDLPDSLLRYGKGPYRFLAPRLVNGEGEPIAMSDRDLCRMAGEAIGRMVQFDSPIMGGGSGPAADWLAFLVGADVPRCDTEEILGGIGRDMLVEMATAAGIDSSGKLGELRARLIGKLPDWRPVSFGAAGPEEANGYGEDDTSDSDASAQEDVA
jgi:ParB/RepB/Spo0J family partition protein